MNWKNTIVPLFSVLLALGGIWYFSGKKIAFVKLETVFNEFQMKKELQKNFDATVKQHEALLDTARMELLHLKMNWEKDKQSEALYHQVMEMAERNDKLEQGTRDKVADLTAKFDEQIHGRLEQYLKEFGESKDVEILMGVMDNGTVLYHKSAADYTADAILYVNKKYLDK
jgi:outer membrane protein